MSTRREKARPQKQQSQTAVLVEKKSEDRNQKSRKEKLSNYLIDISKYVMTGVVIASLFQDMGDSKLLIYVVGLFIAFMALGVGLVLTDKKK